MVRVQNMTIWKLNSLKDFKNLRKKMRKKKRSQREREIREMSVKLLLLNR